MNKERKINLIFLLSLILIVFVVLNGVSATDTNLTTVNNTGVLSGSIAINDNGNQSSNNLLVQSDNYSNNYPETLSVADMKTVCNGSAQLKSNEISSNSLGVSDSDILYISPNGYGTGTSIEDTTNFADAYIHINDGGTIYFTNGNYTNIYDKEISKNLNLIAYNNANVTINATGQGYIFYCSNENANINITGITFADATGYRVADLVGGAIYSKSNLTLKNCQFINNSAVTLGGAVYVTNYCTIINSTFLNNYAGNGGAVASNKQLNITQSVFKYNNVLDTGGAIYINGNCNLNGNILVNNTSKSSRGTIFSYGGNLNADYNWWGNNTPFDGTDFNQIIYSTNNFVEPNNWVIMNFTSTSDFFYPSSENILTVTLNNTISKSNVISDLPSEYSLGNSTVTYTTIAGSLNPTSAYFTNSTTTTFSTPLVSSTNILTATVDNQVLTLTNPIKFQYELYVNGDFTGISDGTLEAPFHDITEAINQANIENHNVTIYIMNGTYNDVNMTVTNNITILNYNNENVTIDANFTGGMFLVTDNNVVLNITGINFINGNGCKYSTSYAGAIYSKGQLFLKNCNFTNNNPTVGSGGCINSEGVLTVEGCNFLNNHGYEGGAIFAYDSSSNRIINSNFVSNSATYGGAVYVRYGLVENCTFINNRANEYGGAAYFSNLIINDSVFENNYAGTAGAAVLQGATLENSTFIKNSAHDLANVLSLRNSNTVKTCLFINNTGVLRGGVISTENGASVINYNCFINNSAQWYGNIVFAKSSGNNYDYNWYGTNSPSFANNQLIYDDTSSKYISPDNWILMNLSASSIDVLNNEPITITASLNTYYNSTDNSISKIPDDISLASRNVIFNSNMGTLNSTSEDTDENNLAIVSYSNSENSYNISATIDNQQLTIDNYNKTSINSTIIGNLTYGEIKFLNITLYDEEGNPLSNQTVNYNINNTNLLSAKTGDKGNVILNLTNYPTGEYTITYSFNANGKYLESENSTSFTILKRITNIESTFQNINYGENLTVIINLTNNNLPVNNKNIIITLNNKTYNSVTNENGTITEIFENLPGGKYTLTYSFIGDEYYTSSNGESAITVTPLKTVVIGADSTIDYGTLPNFTVTLTNNLTPINGKEIVFNVNGVNFTSLTNNLGLASLQLTNLVPGENSITYTFKGDENYTESNNSNIITVNLPKILYVNQSYSGYSIGTIDQPFKNITEAINISNYINRNTTIYIMNGTYNDVNMTIKNNLTISAYNNSNVTIDAEKMGYIFYDNNENNSLIFIGLTFENGTGYNISNKYFGGAIYSNSQLNISNCKFINNSVNSTNGVVGGAIFCNSIFNLTNCEFINNSAYYGGGAIGMFSSSKNTNILNCYFTNNTAKLYGGAIYSSSKMLNINNSTFQHNSVAYNNQGAGGAIYLEGTDSIINGSTFIYNIAVYDGVLSNGNYLINSSLFINNSATTTAAIGANNINITGCVIFNNTATTGGVISYAGLCDAEYNWWGNNTPYNDESLITYKHLDEHYDYIYSNVNLTNWVIMNLTVNPNNIYIGSNTILTATLNQVSLKNGTIINLPNNISLPIRTVTFTSQSGILSSNKTSFTNQTTSTYTGTSTGVDILTATIDNQTINTKVNVNVIPISTSIANNELTSYVNGSVIIYVVDGDNIVNTGSVNIFLDNKAIGTGYVNNGQATINITNIESGNYTVTVFYFAKDPFDSASKTLNLTILSNPQDNITINLPDIIVKPGVNSTIKVNLTDSNDNPINEGNITVTINDVNYTGNVINGTAIVNYTAPTTVGLYNITVTYTNGTYSTSVNNIINVTNMTIDTVLIGNNLTKNYGVNANYTGKLLDIYGNPIIGQHIALNLTRLSDGKSKVYWVTTDTLGEYQLAINLSPGEYTAQASYYGNSNYTGLNASVNSITVLNSNITSTVLTANNFLEPFGAGLNFTGKLTDNLGNPVIGQHIALNLTRLDTGASKVYWVTTDTLGEYQLAINLWTANYTAQCSYAGTSQYSSSSANATITVTK